MRFTLAAGLNGLSSAAAPEAKAVRKNAKAASDFEAMLLAPVLEALQKTFSGPEQDGSTPGASDYRRMATEALAQAMAERGGIGIAKMVLQHLHPPKVQGGS
jgi:Rod binding domain-containing protein